MKALSSISVVALIAMSTTAFAADLPSRRAPPVYVPPPPPAFTWSGFYAGVNVGGGFDSYSNYGLAGINAGAVNAIFGNGNRPGFISTDASGVVGGGQIGYNFQLNQGLIGNALSGFGSTLSPITGLFGLGASSGPVAGIEADADATGIRQTFSSFGNNNNITTAQSRLNFLATVRGRVGYGFGNLLVFGTGGFAYGGVNNNLALINGTGTTVGFGGVNRIQTGYTFGGGVEYAIPTSSFLNVFKSSAVTVKVEYLHYVLGDNVGSIVTTGGAANAYTVRVQNNGNIVRAGLNYKFDFNQPAPVVARY